ncbi:MAG: S41 family peptidase, partial [Bacteroidota bacterium]
MKKIKILLGLLSLSFLNYAQTDSLVSAKALKEDFTVYRASLEEAHPGLYWYRTKEAMDSIFSASLSSLSKFLTEREFYTLIASTTAKIGCLHTTMRPSIAFNNTQINAAARPFPFEIKLDGNRMFIYQNLSADTTIEKGTEILMINNRDVDSLIRFLIDKIPNDGYGDGWSRYALERSFRYYYHLFFGQPKYFDLKTRNKDAIEEVVAIPGRLEKERSRILKERYPDKTLPEPVISLRYDDETESALLSITRFENWKIGKKKYKFLKKKMKDILKVDVKNVILDVGDRGGGNELWGLEILSYFLEKPYTAYKAVEFKTLDYDISKKYSNTSSLAYGLAKLYLNVSKADSTLNQQNYRGLKPYPPKKKRFTGNLYLLVSGATASATQYQASTPASVSALFNQCRKYRIGLWCRLC